MQDWFGLSKIDFDYSINGGTGGGEGGQGGHGLPTHHKGGTKNVYVEYCMHGHNFNINHEFSTMAFRPPHLSNHSSAYV